MKYKIMLVGDQPATLRALLRLFRDEYQVFAVGSGRQALTLLQQHDVAVMISNQRMPSMTGVELMEKTVAVRPQMIKILLAADADAAEVLPSVNSGLIYRSVKKPWNDDDLKLMVKRALDQYEAIKALHLLAMENGRLRARLLSLGEMAVEGLDFSDLGGYRGHSENLTARKSELIEMKSPSLN